MAVKGGFPYKPDYVTPLGEVLDEYMDCWGVSRSELVRRSGLSLKLIDGLLAGEASLDPDTALELQKVFELEASVWLRMEANYREGLKAGKKVPQFDKESAV
ncbi:MAG: hypothetical protein F4X65_07730 [Chloroflexi bacterium]|nr:hypothetical protein [Chloroflexota bacterium]